MIHIPIIGALALAIGTILQKVVLRKRKINIKLYQVLEFLAIIIVMLPLIYFFWKFDAEALQLRNILIFGSVIIFSIIANLLVFYSVKWEKISNLEPAKILEPLFVIILAIIFSFFFENLYEKNLKVIIPAIIAAAALILSHIKKQHLSFNKYFLAAIAGSFFFALELILSRLILDFYSPISFYFLRCSAIFLISLALFRPNFKKADKNVRLHILLIGSIWVIYRVIVYYGYINLGVIFTTLIIMLAPIFIYTFAHIFLKEKIKLRNIISALIIIACIIYAILA
ncbi:EamA family transporter [Candidatus Pacearchaeota archaeon]|nr:EamA family transporter [Candidatus Pacearchaeota archaeon]